MGYSKRKTSKPTAGGSHEGSDGRQSEHETFPGQSVRRARPTIVAIVMVLLSVCVFLVAKYYIGNREVTPPVKQDAPKKVKRPARPSIVSSVSNPQTVKSESNTDTQPSYVEVDGRKIYRNPTNDVGKVVTNAFGKALVIERVVMPDGPMKDGKSLVPRRIFAYDSEVAIDTLMNMDVGYKSLMMLPPNMDQDFQNSMTSKIVIEPEDTEDEIRRKNEMIEIKKELAKRVANGEKVSQIAAETLAYYNKIANIRDTLQQEIFEMEKNGESGDELEEVYEAANVILKEYDALPLHSPKVRKAIIRERLERKKARLNGHNNK